MTEQELRQNAVNIFNSHLGEKEIDGKCPEWISSAYNELISKYAYTVTEKLPRATKFDRTWEWCAATCAAVQYKAGLGKHGCYEMSCGNVIKIAKEKGVWLEDEKKYTKDIAKIGDEVIYYWTDDSKTYAETDLSSGSSHIGMIAEVHDDYMIVDEGNYSNSIKQRKLLYNGRFIRGIVQLDYASAAKELEDDPTERAASDDTGVTLLNLSKGAKGEAVKGLQILLNGRIATKLTIDGGFGILTLAAVKKAQSKYGLNQDGIVNAVLWNHLING